MIFKMNVNKIQGENVNVELKRFFVFLSFYLVYILLRHFVSSMNKCINLYLHLGIGIVYLLTIQKYIAKCKVNKRQKDEKTFQLDIEVFALNFIY